MTRKPDSTTWAIRSTRRKPNTAATPEKRRSDLQKAEADLSKAQLQLRRGPLLSEIDRLKNETKAADAEARVASLKRSNHSHDVAEAAALRVLELQRDRQKVSLERALNNADRLIVRARRWPEWWRSKASGGIIPWASRRRATRCSPASRWSGFSIPRG